MKATVKCKNCHSQYVYCDNQDEVKNPNLCGQIQTDCPYCGSNAKE